MKPSPFRSSWRTGRRHVVQSITHVRVLWASCYGSQPLAICVAGAVRGQGIGRTLMREAEAWARDQGATDLRLNVWAFNEGAVRLYRELGYEVRLLTLGKPLAD